MNNSLDMNSIPRERLLPLDISLSGPDQLHIRRVVAAHVVSEGDAGVLTARTRIDAYAHGKWYGAIWGSIPFGQSGFENGFDVWS